MKQILFIFCAIIFSACNALRAAEELPNILWLTCEDTGRHLGCYDFPDAVTPTLDNLAQHGMRFKHAWSNYPVCAPARTTIITGCYPASLGAEQMRSFVPLPDTIKMYPHYLRQAGYYCTNNRKGDYNVFDKKNPQEKSCWDVMSKDAHWKNRPQGKPFFAIFNFEITHESQIRNKYELKRDPEKTAVPKYHPNISEVRRDWTQYHERITQMDSRCAEYLTELEAAGLSESTIIFFFGDHGSGMPRNKRTPLDCGLGVPMIVYFPPQFRSLAPKEYQENGISERLISFVDLAPTLLSLAGVKPPATMQGIPFAGQYAQKRDYLYGFRGRMDERADLVRSVSDGRYVYVRNYHPEIIYGSRNDFMFQTRTTQVWRELYDLGKLPPEQKFFWELKPTEELYDLNDDPDEVHNLADSAEHRELKQRLNSVLKKHTLEIRDVHFLPENMLHERFAGSTAWEMGHDSQKYPLEKILDAADAATDRLTPDEKWRSLLNDSESAVRYWAAIGILLRVADTAKPDGTKVGGETKKMYEKWKPAVEKLFEDAEPAVSLVAAEILGRYGNDAEVNLAAQKILTHTKSDSPYTVWLALESLDRFAFRCEKFRTEIDSLTDKGFEGRVKTVFSKVMTSVKKQLPSEK
jgi:uncharacterized sulfatase